MGRKFRLAALLAMAGALASVNAACALTDPATGVGVDPPAPFVAETAGRGAHDVAFGVNSTAGGPAKAGTSPYLCKIGFKATSFDSSLTQADINARVAGKQWREVSRKVLERMFAIDAETDLPQGPATGVEYLVTPKFGPDAANVRSYIGLIETPRGRVMTSCATTAADWATALGQFRAIQATISLPR